MDKSVKLNIKTVKGTKLSKGNDYCPRCKYRGNVTRLTIDKIAVIPVSIWVVFRITIGVNVELKYCKTCGYFKLHISQKKVGTLLKIMTPIEA